MTAVGAGRSVEADAVVARTAVRGAARTALWGVSSLWALIVVLSAGALVLTVTNWSTTDAQDHIVQFGTSLAGVGYGTVGALIAARRNNRIETERRLFQQGVPPGQ